MKPSPTDLQILDTIYNDYYERFLDYSDENKTRSTKNYVPIDLEKIANKLAIDSDLLFGRLYYHLDNKYGYKESDDVEVPFFAIRLGTDKHCINFPYLGAVLADLRDENKKYKLATTMAVISFFISVVSFLLSILV